jgi:hypothetical protein
MNIKMDKINIIVNAIPKIRHIIIIDSFQIYLKFLIIRIINNNLNRKFRLNLIKINKNRMKSVLILLALTAMASASML